MVTAPVAVVGSGVVARTAVKALAASGLEQHQFTVRGSAGGGDGQGVRMAGHPVCVFCADVADRDAVLSLNRQCLEQGTALLAGWVMGDVGQVGPAVLGGDGGCLQCLDLRVQATTGGSAFSAAGRVDPSVARLVGKRLAAEVVGLVAGEDGLSGRIFRLYAPDRCTRHLLRRTWECPACSRVATPPSFCRRRSVLVDRSVPDRTRILDAEPALVDPLVGPVRALVRFEPAPRDPPLCHWVATLVDPAWAAHGLDAVVCGGTALDDDSARAAALGEALDRMSATPPQNADLLVAPYKEVAGEALDPGAWDLFHPSTRKQPDFPFPRTSPGAPLTWVWGWSLTSSTPVLVPAGRVFVPPRPRTQADLADHPVVSGFATGSTWDEAVLAATLEVIERDAFRIAWANRLTLPAVDLEHSPPVSVADYIDAFQRKGLEVRCRLILLDTGVPVVVAMVRSPYPEDPPIVVSAAADLHVAEACRRAIAELAANRLAARSAFGSNGIGNSPEDEPGLPSALRSWWDSSTSVGAIGNGEEASSPSAELTRIVEMLGRAGLEVAAVDLTPQWLRDLDLRTVKVVVPGAYPLPVDHRWPHLGGRRLTAAPVAAGLLASPLPAARLSSSPPTFP